MLILSPSLSWPGSAHLGFAVAPSIGVCGAFFPDWMFCGLGAVLLTALLHLLMRATEVTRRAGRWAWLVGYPAISLLFALLGWLLFFMN